MACQKNFKTGLCFALKILIVFSLFHSVYATQSFLTLSDVHYASSNSHEDKETGPEFLKIAMAKYRQLSQQVDFIIVLGDLPAHSFLNNPQKGEYEKEVFANLYKNDTSKKPVFYIPGNNDSLSGNYQPFELNGISPLNFAQNWDGACAHCKDLIIDDSHMYHDGYYSSYVIPENKQIMLIALNATQWTKTPFFSSYPNQEKDALEQLAWLNHQLNSHHAQQVLIAMHEPPGNSYQGKPVWHKRYLQKFIEILNKNNKLYGEITLLSSHTHMDEFRKIHLEDGRNIYVYSTPSISRDHHNNPGMKIFTLNKNLELANFTTYYTSDVHSWQNQKYSALSKADAIFPHCINKTLPACLNQYKIKQVCAHMAKGLFYGVKSAAVSNNACIKFYHVN